ncbi:hypothetical protein ACLOJK_002375 [Asimina triloba]
MQAKPLRSHHCKTDTQAAPPLSSAFWFADGQTAVFLIFACSLLPPISSLSSNLACSSAV